MKNKRFYLICFGLLVAPFSVKMNGAPAHPLHIEPAGVYSKIRPVIGGWENRDVNLYEKTGSIRLDLEYAFNDYLSISTAPEFSRRKKTDTKNVNRLERIPIGIKLASMNGYDAGAFSFATGVIFYNKLTSTPFENENSDLYRVRVHGELAKKIGDFELGLSLHFQTETNSQFKEKNNEEFQRHYQLGGSLIWNMTKQWRLHLETEYRHPYSRDIDIHTLFWHVYPGISWAINENHRFTFSATVPLKKEGYADRGAEFGYIYFY